MQPNVDQRTRIYEVGDLTASGNLAAPGPGADYDRALAHALESGRLRSCTVTGADPGSEAERFLRHYVIGYGDPAVWGHEYHLIVPVGTAPATGSAPVAQVRIAWSADGDGTAAVIPWDVFREGDEGTVAQWCQTLPDRFGVGPVTARGRDWTVGELGKVAGALLLVPAEDRPALAGIGLVRMPAPDGAEATTGAMYHRDQASRDDRVVDITEIQVGDLAFGRDGRVFVGSQQGSCRPVSYQGILHEVGHAVDRAAIRRTASAWLSATGPLREAQAALRAANDRKAAGDQVSGATERGQVRQAEAACRQAETARSAALGQQPSEQLKALVQARGISPAITLYAQASWPAKPDELYAEAYSLWLLDKPFLLSFSADLADFFDSGRYRA